MAGQPVRGGTGHRHAASLLLNPGLTFLALLGKQYGVEPAGWREAAGAYGEVDARRSIADVTDPTSLAEVRATKQAAKAAAKAAKA